MRLPYIFASITHTHTNHCTTQHLHPGFHPHLAQISGFYVSEGAPRHFIRFCFCKQDAKLQAACDRLQTYFGPGGKGAV